MVRLLPSNDFADAQLTPLSFASTNIIYQPFLSTFRLCATSKLPIGLSGTKARTCFHNYAMFFDANGLQSRMKDII
jgi:hypothetical protein